MVVLERDEAMLRALLECDSLGQVRMAQLLEYRAGERVKPPDVKVRNNILTATAEVDSMSVYLRLKDRFERRITSSAQTVERVVEVNRLNRWQKFWMRTGQVLGFALLLFGGYKLRKLLTI